jgi:Tfp pilus assembly protein PilF
MPDRLDALLAFYEKDPNDSFVIYGLALEYISRKEFDKGEEYLQILIKNDPKYVPAYMQYARLKENQNLIDDAKKLYRMGINAAKQIGDKEAVKEMEEFLNELG